MRYRWASRLPSDCRKAEPLRGQWASHRLVTDDCEIARGGTKMRYLGRVGSQLTAARRNRCAGQCASHRLVTADCEIARGGRKMRYRWAGRLPNWLPQGGTAARDNVLRTGSLLPIAKLLAAARRCATGGRVGSQLIAARRNRCAGQCASHRLVTADCEIARDGTKMRYLGRVGSQLTAARWTAARSDVFRNGR